VKKGDDADREKKVKKKIKILAGEPNNVTPDEE
jgi:hypothetical protein